MPAADPALEARLYLITGARPGLESFLEAAVRGGVDLVQLREKTLDDRELLPVLEEARAITRRLGLPLVVNDRPDLAVLVGADYVHVGQDDMPTEAARRFGIPVGLSTHSPDELDAAEADYVGVGPVYATPTKEGRPAVGLELVRYAAEHARVPWFAIGGIDAGNLADVVAAGATRIAVVRAIGDAEDPERAARELRAALP
ncbi:MAG TPA: thiamine phosphate synthase [Gaiellaceae bacterium]|nr:thiamine phosphate synthase [Gaiellaceae bacterium]